MDDAGSIKGTLSGDLPEDDEPPGGATVRGTLSGDLGPEIDDPAFAKGVKGTLSGEDSVSGDRWSGLKAPAADPGAEVGDGLAAPDLEVARELGRGGMGIVWLATQRSLNRPVAVKTLRAELIGGTPARKFEAEALITGRLEHPNIPPVHSYGRDDLGRPFLSMKLVKGVEWATLLEPRTEEEKARAAKIDLRAHLETIERVCEAIAFAHAHGIIHRDLKPENVMVGEFGEVLVMDWGIALDLEARDKAAAASAGAITGPRRPVGTPAYLPPEMAAADEARMGPWTDVYLLGGMLYELLTGTPPHKGDSIMAVLLAAQKGEIDPPRGRAPGRDIPEALAEVAMKALEADPARRYQKVTDFEDAIKEYLENEASVKLSDAAIAELCRIENRIASKDAPASEIYPAFAACVAELRQAEKLWSANRAARDGLVAARLAYASFAIDRGDVTLAGSQLAQVPPGNPRAALLHARIAARRRRRLEIMAAIGALLLLLAAGFWKSVADFRRRTAATRMAEGSGWLSYEERIDVFHRALAVDDTWPQGWTDLGRAYISRSYDSYIAGNPTRTSEVLNRAVPCFDRAVELEPSNPITVADRGYLHVIRGYPDLARADYARALELDPASHAGCEGATFIALLEHRFADAEAAATRAIEVEAGETDYFRRSIARFALGNVAGALADAQKAEKLTTSGEDEYYHALNAVILIGQGKEKEGGDRLVRGVRYHPRGPHLMPLLAYHAARQGDLPRARAFEALARAGHAAYAHAWLALDPEWSAFAHAKPPIDAIGRAMTLEQDLAAVVPKEPPRSFVLCRRGEERFARGEHELALADAERTLGDDPADGNARLLRARCFTALGHLDAARSDLDLANRLAPHRVSEVADALAELEKAEAEARAHE